jgi:hypothetical protein
MDKIISYKNKDSYKKLKSEQDRRWREKHKEYKKIKDKEYYEKNKSKILARCSIYRKNNREKINASRRTEEFKEHQREHIKNKKAINIQFKLRERLRKRLKKAMDYYTKTGKLCTSKDYGVDYKKIVEHLKPFPKNIEEYHIDHIKPLCSFDLTNPEEIKKAFVPENHQWLLAFENKSKGGKYAPI